MTKVKFLEIINKAEQLREALGIGFNEFANYCEVAPNTYKKYVIDATPEDLGNRKGIYMLIEAGINRKSREVSEALRKINEMDMVQA